MSGETVIKLELDIAASRMLQQVHVHNQHLEKSIQNGIERALKEIFEDENFEETICKLVKGEIKSSVKKAAQGWAIERKIEEVIHESIARKVERMAGEWSEKIGNAIK